jgi:predicted small metal-binding protein
MPDSPSNDVYICCADVVPGCAFTASAANEEELLKQIATHAAAHHGMSEITPELAAKVKAAIKTR